MKLALACLTILLLSSLASAVEDRRPGGFGRAAPSNACGQAEELAAARRSIAEGNREAALLHLRRAKEFVAACERNAVDPELESRPTAFAKASAGAAPLSTWPVRTKPRRGSDRSPPHSPAAPSGCA